MCEVGQEQCEQILKSYYGDNSDIKIVKYELKPASNACIGLMSLVSILHTKVLHINENKLDEVRFFIKFKPQNEFHLNCVTKANCFSKESAFFGTMFKEMRDFLLYKSVPKCHLIDCEEMIVLEDLSQLGYKNCTNPVGFDLKHTLASLKTLADIHAASLLHQHKIGTTLDRIIPYKILRPWFIMSRGYPGYYDYKAASDIVKRIIDKYFTNYTDSVKQRAKQLCEDFPKNLQMSNKFRNVITHQDLWCNNVMFKYDNDGNVEDAIIIDFQTYGYNPPSLDVLMMIYCDTDQVTRDERMEDLLKYYHQCLTKIISYHNVNPDAILSYSEFKASMNETLPAAIVSAPLFIQSVLIPVEEAAAIFGDMKAFRKYMEEDRSIVLELMEKYDFYRTRVTQAVEDILKFASKNNN